jgi:DNA-binding HxlR family transcriptional regulator
MQRTQFGAMACSIARTLDVAGEPWSPLIVRNIFVGITRFDQLQESLGISRKVLAERLRWLTETGVLERREYSARPPRHEYLLTAKGLELVGVLMVMVSWGDKWLAGAAGPPVLYRHHGCGQIGHAELVCSECGRPMRATDIDVLPGPGAAPQDAAGHEEAGPAGDAAAPEDAAASASPVTAVRLSSAATVCREPSGGETAMGYALSPGPAVSSRHRARR